VRGPGFALAVVAGLIWAALFGPALHRRWIRSAVPRLFNDDVRSQIWPMCRFVDPHLSRGDYLADYQLRAFLPLGYRSLYRLLALWWDPASVSKALPYIHFR